MKGEYANYHSNNNDKLQLHQTQNFKHHQHNDGATIEVVRRPRGRPPGSKNKPKPPSIITRDLHVETSFMSPYILQVPTGADIVDSVSRFCTRQNMGLCVLNGSGIVTNVSLQQPSNTNTSPASVVTFHGSFSILSISATIIAQNSSVNPNGFTISIGGPQGQVVGGVVVGPLLSEGSVYLIAASFSNPSYHNLPDEEEEVGGGSQSPPAEDESCGMPMYSSNHLASSDHVIWEPIARQAPPLTDSWR